MSSPRQSKLEAIVSSNFSEDTYAGKRKLSCDSKIKLHYIRLSKLFLLFIQTLSHVFWIMLCTELNQLNISAIFRYTKKLLTTKLHYFKRHNLMLYSFSTIICLRNLKVIVISFAINLYLFLDTRRAWKKEIQRIVTFLFIFKYLHLWN